MTTVDSRPTEDDSDGGPDCPDCGATTNKWVHVLDEDSDEHVFVINCPDCGFEIETESNKAHEARIERWRQRTESDLGVSDIL